MNTNISIKIKGEGNKTKPGFKAYSDDERMFFEAADPRMPENLELAREYSLAIKEFS
ncbi:MAG: hypothetical protein ABEK04_04045 [Candidatus Nanohalobium sp.]